MQLSNKNYYSPEANREYLSVSQYKDFVGTLGKPACEACALAKLDGTWEMEKTTALMIGSYVDSYFEGSLEEFKRENPDIFTKSGSLKAEYRKSEELIQRIERDPLFMAYMSGEKQVVMTAELFGAKWKIKMDSYIPDKCIVDLKVMKSLKEVHYVKDYGYMDFIQYWGYDIQGAIYQEVVYQNTGKRLPFYIAGISKEKEPDIEIIYIDNQRLQERLYEVERNVQNVLMLKNKAVEPIRCEKCDYCKHTKVLKKPIHYSELLGEV